MGKFEGKSKGKKTSAFARAAAKSEPSEPKGAEFEPGTYRVRLKDCQESDNGSFGFTFTGAGDDEEIGDRIQWFSTKGKAAHVSGPRIKSLCMALLGMSSAGVDEYNAFDPGGEFVDAILRFELDDAAEYMTAQGIAKSAKIARKALDEAEVMIQVSKGSEKDDGGFFRNATFAPVDSDETEDEDSDDEEPESERRPAKKSKPAPAKVSKRKPVEEDEDDEDAEDEDEDEDAEDESERRPAKKKARRA